MTNGEINILKSGYYSITAQLHNKDGNPGKWIRTNIVVTKPNDDDDDEGSIRARR